MIEISVVAPLYNEARSVAALYSRLKKVLDGLGRSYEIVFVDDGSRDDTYKIAHSLAMKDPLLKLVKLRSNFGQTAGIAAGIDHASGKIIIPMDGDLQHAPEDIPNFIIKIDEGYDIVSGWRKKRVDGLILRRVPSMIANRLMRILSGIDLHDFGTTFKAYRREVIAPVRLYGQFHRFIPVLCRGVMKVKICEIPIQNIVRPTGESNYGISRSFTVFFDLIRLKFLLSFYSRPLQLFGSIGASLFGVGSAVMIYILIQRLWFGTTLATIGSSVFLLGVSCILAGLQFFCFGLLAELMVKLYHDGHKVRPYVLESIVGNCSDPILKWS